MLFRSRLFAAILPNARLAVAELATLHIAVGQAFAAAANALIASCGVPGDSVRAIGSHGQTLHHAPRGAEPYSLQIGDAATIAARTGIPTVADFRADEAAHRDEALKQGAEEAPGYKLLSETIKAGCRLAIRLSERI